MELRQLRAFVAVAEEGSFTRAADRLAIVQSAISATVRSLERELGTPVFDRSTRRVALSDAGAALLPEARNVLAAATLAADSVAQAKGGLRGSVALGTMQAQGMRAVSAAQVVAAFRRDHPLVHVSVRHVGGSMELARHVREGGLDLAILSLIDGRSTGLRLTPVGSEPMALACTADHVLAGRDAVDLEDLAGTEFVDMPEGWGIRMAADRAFALAGLQRAVAFEVNDTESVTGFVREGLAVALLPPSMTAHAPEIVMVPVRGEPARFATFLAEPAGRRPTAAARALAATIRELAPATQA
jgi:DNA-binding transcriptional LysR family regulator